MCQRPDKIVVEQVGSEPRDIAELSLNSGSTQAFAHTPAQHLGFVHTPAQHSHELAQ